MSSSYIIDRQLEFPFMDEDRKRFDEEMDRLDKKFEPWLKAIRDSERLTEEDYRIVINAR